MNETVSLRKTVQILYETCKLSDLKEIILVVSPKSTPDCLKVGEDLRREAKVPFLVLVQTRPFAGGAYQDAFDHAQGSHVIMMASDLETNPNDVQKLIAEAKRYPDAVICTSRWCSGAVFGKGYSRAKYLANYIFQQIMKVVYGAGLTDWTFGFRLFPRSVVTSIRWEEMRHPFFLETVLKPLSLGFQTREIATSWSPRQEGVSQNPFWRNFLYFKTVVKVRLAPKETLWREEIKHPETT